MATKIQGGSSTAGLANVNSTYELQVALNPDAELAGSVRIFSENDPGGVLGTPYVSSPETDEDFRIRAALDNPIDNELFNYTAQNTGKHNYTTAVFTSSFGSTGLVINASSVNTSGANAILSTRAFFPLLAPGVLYTEFAISFSSTIPTNSISNGGYYIPNAAATPLDGVYISFRNGEVLGVINVGGVEETVNLPYTVVNDQTIRCIITIHKESVNFWIDNALYGSLSVSSANSQPFRAASLPFSFGYYHLGIAGAAIQPTLKEYNISLSGITCADALSSIGNRIYGSYQGLSGNTMGSLASYVNSSNPWTAVPTNTTSTVLTALGGQGWETDTLAVNTDGIIQSYQVPSASTSVQGRRLVIYGVKIDSYIQTALTGGGYVAQYSLCFGHTAVSLATSESATTKASRRIPLGLQTVASAAVASTLLGTVQISLKNPVYVNPGEFVAIAKKKIGTAPSAGVIGHIISFDYGWE